MYLLLYENKFLSEFLANFKGGTGSDKNTEKLN